MRRKTLYLLACALATLVFGAVIAEAQGPQGGGTHKVAANAGTAFTYQGQLKKSGGLVNSTCAFNVGLWDDPSAGTQQGFTQTLSGVSVTSGLFTIQPDFVNNLFNGDARYLSLRVQCTGDGSPTQLGPRQQITPAPMAFALPGLYTQQNGSSPNVIGGHSSNVVSQFLVGVTVGGGGTSGTPNSALNHYVTIGGGRANTASGIYATVSGGFANTASGSYATVPGGISNFATMSYTLAAGQQANANHQGAFVWADSTNAAFSSMANDQFLVRASGGMGVNTNGTPAAFQVAKDISGSGNYGQIEAIGATNNGKRMTMGFDTASSVGWLEASVTGSSYNDLLLNPAGANILVGTTITTGDKLTVNGDMRVGTSGTNGCLKNFGGGTITGSCSSDVRLKKNIEPFALMLDQVSQLRPVHYEWRAAEFPQYGFAANTTSYGLIAQEVERVLPELVGQDERGYKTVNYSELPLTLLQALKELRTEKDAQIAAQEKQIVAQQSQITELEQHDAAMEARLAALEQTMKESGNAAGTDSGSTSTQWVFLSGLIFVGVIIWRQNAGGKR